MIDLVGRSKLDLATVCARLRERYPDLPEFYIQVEGAGPDDAWDYVTDCPIYITHVLDYKRQEKWWDWFPEAPEWNFLFCIFDKRGEEIVAALPELIEGEVKRR